MQEARPGALRRNPGKLSGLQTFTPAPRPHCPRPSVSTHYTPIPDEVRERRSA